MLLAGSVARTEKVCVPSASVRERVGRGTDAPRAGVELALEGRGGLGRAERELRRREVRRIRRLRQDRGVRRRAVDGDVEDVALRVADVVGRDDLERAVAVGRDRPRAVVRRARVGCAEGRPGARGTVGRRVGASEELDACDAAADVERGRGQRLRIRRGGVDVLACAGSGEGDVRRQVVGHDVRDHRQTSSSCRRGRSRPRAGRRGRRRAPSCPRRPASTTSVPAGGRVLVVDGGDAGAAVARAGGERDRAGARGAAAGLVDRAFGAVLSTRTFVPTADDGRVAGVVGRRPRAGRRGRRRAGVVSHDGRGRSPGAGAGGRVLIGRRGDARAAVARRGRGEVDRAADVRARVGQRRGRRRVVDAHGSRPSSDVVELPALSVATHAQVVEAVGRGAGRRVARGRASSSTCPAPAGRALVDGRRHAGAAVGGRSRTAPPFRGGSSRDRSASRVGAVLSTRTF